MKKILITGLFAAAVFAVSAQEVTIYRAHNPNTVVMSETIVVPQHIMAEFDEDYPGITIIAWDPIDTWWRGSFRDGSRITYVFYNEALDDYRVALPVIQNNVPESVINAAIRQHGPSLYRIAEMKGADGNVIYQVHLIDNGQSGFAWMNADGMEVTNVFKDHDDDDDEVDMDE
jgi:hypothetical protein